MLKISITHINETNTSEIFRILILRKIIIFEFWELLFSLAWLPEKNTFTTQVYALVQQHSSLLRICNDLTRQLNTRHTW